MRKAFITGGAGFIGSRVVREFLAADYEVQLSSFAGRWPPLASTALLAQANILPQNALSLIG